MRAREFLREYNENRTEEYEGLHMALEAGSRELMLRALDDWGNELGHVRMHIGDDDELDPQDLFVKEKFQGQGIAKIMYDYLDDKGYEIHRSWDQTDAGAGFWNKHRGPDVRVWEDELNEAFEDPYRIKWEKSDFGDYDAIATLADGTHLNIMFNDDGDSEWQVEFHRNNSQEVTGEGDAQRVFATVLHAIQQFIQKEQPWRLIFSASKDNWAKQQQNSQSRAKLYDRLVQRYASAWGYEEYAEDHGDQVTYELTRKK